MRSYFCCLQLICSALCWLPADAVRAQKVVTMVAGERPPYIGANLQKYGYAHELAEAAFKRRGYQLKVKFVPWARADLMARRGEVDGILPIDGEGEQEPGSDFIFSKTFPGGAIGLLKKKSLSLPDISSEMITPGRAFYALKSFRFGVLKAGISIPEFDAASYLKKEIVISDLSNMDMLSLGRIDLILIDKYTAADLMVGQRPNLIGEFEFVKPALVSGSFQLAFSKKSSNAKELARAFNQGLDELYKDGTVEQIMARHGLFFQKNTVSGRVKLTIGTVNNSDMVVMQGLSKEFEKLYPKVSLDWRVMDENTLRLRLLSDAAISDGQFDVVTIGTYEAPIWARQQWLSPIQGLPEKYDVGDLLPSVRESLSYGGALYALPFYAEGIMTYYRKDLFANAGLVMPLNPSYTEILAYAAKLHSPGKGIYGICLRGKPGWGENMGFINSLAHSFGGRWFDQRWRPQLNTAEWKKAVDFYVDALGNYGPPHPDRNGFNENLNLFAAGQCAIWVDATVAAGLLFDPKRSKVATQLGFVAAPSGAAGKSTWLWSWALAIPSSSEHKAEALQFIAWATSKEYIRNVARRRGWLAVPPGTRNSTYANQDYLNAAPFAQFALEAINSVTVKPAGTRLNSDSDVQFVGIPEYPALGTQVGQEMAKALRREQPVDEALRRSQALIEEQMTRSGYYK